MKERESTAKLKFYNTMLPYGYRKKVAEIAGVRLASVSEYLYGKYNSKRIEDAILIVIAEVQAEKKKLLINAGLI